jgi:hypothetical protein
MERLVPVAAPDPIPPQGGSAVRSTVYTLLAMALVAGIWVRFNAQIAAIAPSLAAPAAEAADRAGEPGGLRGLMALGLLPAAQARAAVAEMGLPSGESAALAAALQRGRLRLARLGLVDDSPTLQGGHVVQVSAGGYTRQVMLTRDPVVVTLPVGPVGSVSFSTPEKDGVGIVGLTVSGPVRLPELQAGQVFTVGVIAQ